MKAATIRVLRLPAENAAFVETIPNTLTAMQGCVGGYIEWLRVEGRVGLYVNEEGRMLELPRNSGASKLWGATILGDAILVRIDEDGEAVDLTDADLKAFTL